jgi:peptide/nickel transport system permease protein
VSQAPSPALETLRRALRSRTLMIGSVILLFWIACALFGRHMTPLDPYADDLLSTLARPSGAHWFGTDQLGRDVFSRVIIGARDILIVAPLATLLGTLLGTALGLVIGTVRGVLDDIVSRIIEALQALPLVIVALMMLAAVGTSNATVVLVIGFVFTPLIARTVRAATLNEVDLDYVAAARLRGDGLWSIIFIEVLPNVLPVAIVEMTVRLGYAIFFVASLSFIGFGIQPPSADWGIAIAENYSLIGSYWWTVLFDAGATASLIIGVNLVADGLNGVFER